MMHVVWLTIRGMSVCAAQCESFDEAREGLCGLAALDDDEGLMLPSEGGLHTVGVRFPIDVVWMDEAGQTLAIDENVAPGRPHLPSKGPFALELAGGWFQRHLVR